MPITIDSPILGPATGTFDEAVDYAIPDINHPTAIPIGQYITELWRLAPLVGMDPAVLFAQAVHETANFTSFWWRTTRNPAGIGITDGGAQNNPTFSNGTDAARAHIVHMSVYLPDSPVFDQYLDDYVHLDPRYLAVVAAGYAGTVKTIRDLTGKWATDRDYHTKIAAKHAAIFGAQGDGTGGPIALPETPGAITFGRVPMPPFTDRPIPHNTAWDDLGPRTIRAVAWHRMIGTFLGTDSWFRGGGAGTALTDFGIAVAAQDGAGLAGTIYRWNDPRGRRAPWANGRVSAPYGDGKAFVDRYGVNAVNRDVVSIEISGKEYTTPLDDKARDAIAALTAYWADQYRVSWQTFPLIPGEGGRSFVIWHQEFTIGTGKVCPGQVVMSETPALIERTRAILKRYQTADAPPIPVPTTTPAPQPEPTPDPLDLPPGMSPELARRYYGRYQAPWGTAYAFSTETTGPAGQATRAWITRGKASIPAGGEWWQGRWPELSEVIRRGGDESEALAFRWLDGSTWEWEAA